MIRDITIGQYYQTDSVLHRTDARVKIVGTLLYVVSLFIFRHYIGFLVSSLFFAWLVWLSNVPFRYIVKGLKPIMMMLIFTAVLQLFCTTGNDLFHVGMLHVTKQGVHNSVFMTLRLVLMMLGASLMTLTTTPARLTDGMEKLLHPLRHLHVPVHDITMMMSIALRFIPIFTEELDKIMKAQLARGADFESGNIVRRLKNIVPIFVPLFASALRRSNELAYAMDARCYHGGDGRTKMKPLKYTQQDMLGYGILFIYLALLLLADRMVRAL